MSRIRILSEHLANQIAAGEVVERPASVVKELVENSLDAGADNIDVQIDGGGVRLMRVADNGCGMDGDDVLLCIERHATSKLQDESQLNAIATLGFRGEALPSIGSVSRMTILSRPPGAESGTEAELRYGALHAVHDTGCAQGTIIEVRHLFGNMPARKKFLKSARTETYHVEEVMKNLAIANPSVGFTLKFDNRTVLDLRAGSDLEERVRQVFSYTGPMLSLEQAGVGEGEDLQVDGYLLLPESTPSRTARLRILVNGRAVQDKMIRHAVVEGLHGFLMKGYQPAGAVLIGIDPSLVDVNVHPAKREIRFRNSNKVHGAVVSAVSRAMDRYQERSRKRLFTASLPDGQQNKQSDMSCLTTAEPEPEEIIRSVTPEVCGFSAGSYGRSTRVVAQESIPPAPENPVQASLPKPPVSMHSEKVVEHRKPDGAEDFNGLRLIGQLLSLYLLCEKDGHLVIIDQHAAHERILFGRLRQGYMEKEVPQQQLLFPVTVELGPDHIEVIEKYGDQLVEIGLEVEFFGDATWIIKGIPAVMKGMEPVDVLHHVLDGLQNSKGHGRAALDGYIDEILASMACKAAIKAGNRLDPEEMIELLQQMQESEVFSHCPHGRPVIKEFNRKDIEKWFHRHGG